MSPNYQTRFPEPCLKHCPDIVLTIVLQMFLAFSCFFVSVIGHCNCNISHTLPASFSAKPTLRFSKPIPPHFPVLFLEVERAPEPLLHCRFVVPLASTTCNMFLVCHSKGRAQKSKAPETNDSRNFPPSSLHKCCTNLSEPYWLMSNSTSSAAKESWMTSPV